ncbi:hypothetical protein [Flavobacterium sp. NRK1]|uniref:hypothetical protein n=1 Tax=Flavobacterium sp. NRK1 TaxID=2954929 RepID=UPI0020930E93|nr:hypothetical protein [Flavobacterium sp. NRK1]MCO6146548.1 hypothetical protein [Flavobacterium sp. NRK1]
MALNYEDLEKRFDCACNDAVSDLSVQYKNTYQTGGPGRLSAFLELIKLQFEQVESAFIRDNELSVDIEALRRIKLIAKSYAKKCLDEYSKISI